MTTTFDGSSGGDTPPQATAWSPTNGSTPHDDSPDSLLDQLRERVEERDDEEPQEWIKEVPKLGIRIICDPDIENGDYQRWLKASFPKGRGRRSGRASSPMDMDQLALSARALTATCLRLEIKRDGEWRPMIGRDGEPYTLESQELLRTFNVMDTTSVLRKLFGRDSKVIDAGQELLAEAGYLGDDADDDDPA